MGKRIQNKNDLNSSIVSFMQGIIKIGASSKGNVFDETVRTLLLKELIPHGLLTPKEFVETKFGKEMAANLSSNGDKPEENLIPFLVAYQYMDLKAQLMALGKHEEPSTPEGEEALRDLAVQNVSESFQEIVQGLGSEGMSVILSAVTQQKVRVLFN